MADNPATRDGLLTAQRDAQSALIDFPVHITFTVAPNPNAGTKTIPPGNFEKEAVKRGLPAGFESLVRAFLGWLKDKSGVSSLARLGNDAGDAVKSLGEPTGPLLDLIPG